MGDAVQEFAVLAFIEHIRTRKPRPECTCLVGEGPHPPCSGLVSAGWQADSIFELLQTLSDILQRHGTGTVVQTTAAW